MYGRRFLVALLILLLGPLQACRTANESSAGDGTLRVVNGTCKVTFKTETKTINAGASVPISMGAMLETDANGTAVVNWGQTSQILQKSTTLTFLATSKTPGYGVSKVELLKGVASFFLPKADSPEFKFQASSHSIVAAVKGTMFQMTVDAGDDSARVETMRGTVFVFARSDGAKASDEKPSDTADKLATVEKGDVYVFNRTGAAPATGAPAAGKPASPTLSPGLNRSATSGDSITAWELMQEFLLKNPIMNF